MFNDHNEVCASLVMPKLMKLIHKILQLKGPKNLYVNADQDIAVKSCRRPRWCKGISGERKEVC